MQIHNMPKASLLYWSSVYCKGGSKLLFYARLITQIFTKSNYEHVAVCRQCPQKFHGKTVIDNKGIIKLKAGEYYMFEAHKKYGITIETFTKRFEGKFCFSNYWSGKVFIQPLLKRLENDNINYYKDNGNYDDAFEDCLNMLSEKYPIVWAIFSAFDENKFVRWILKKFNIKPQLNKENFCSSFALLIFKCIIVKQLIKILP